MDECTRCGYIRDGFLMPTYEGEIIDTDNDDDVLSFVCSHCLLKEINKTHSISTLLNGMKVK